MEWFRALASDQVGLSRNQAAEVAYVRVSAGLLGGFGCCDLGDIMNPQLSPGGNYCLRRPPTCAPGLVAPNLASFGAPFLFTVSARGASETLRGFCDVRRAGVLLR